MVVFIKEVVFEEGALGLGLQTNMQGEHLVEVVDPKGQAGKAGVMKGFIVMRIGCTQIDSSLSHEEVTSAIKAEGRPFKMRLRAFAGYEPGNDSSTKASPQALRSTVTAAPISKSSSQPVIPTTPSPTVETKDMPQRTLSVTSAQLAKLIGNECLGLGKDAMREYSALSSDEAALQRLLEARQHRMPQAKELGLQCIKWRAKVRPDLITPRDVPIAFAQGTWRFLGFAKNGMPVVLVRARLWDPHKYSVQEYIQYVAYFLEQNIKRAEARLQRRETGQTKTKTEGQNQAQNQAQNRQTSNSTNIQNFIIFDFNKMSYLKSDFSKLKQLAKITSTYYPERLGVACVINANMVFRAMWSVMKGWVDDRTASKAHFFANNYQEFLNDQIGRDQLPPDLGGTHEEWPVCEPHEHPEM